MAIIIYYSITHKEISYKSSSSEKHLFLRKKTFLRLIFINDILKEKGGQL